LKTSSIDKLPFTTTTFSPLLINSLALYVTDYLISGIYIESWQALLVSAVVIGLVNTFIKPIAAIITLPITILTIGVFALLVNVAMLALAAFIVPGFHIDNFLSAFLGTIVLSLTSSVLNRVSKPKVI